MTKATPYQAFGKLLIEGIKQTSLARRESLQETHQYLADELGYAVNTLYVWRRGEHLPDNPETVADLARIFAKTWKADQKWVNDFLDKGEYGPVQAVEALNHELFGSPVPVVSRSLTPQTGASRAIPTQSTTDRHVQPFTLSGHRLTVAFLNFLTVLFFRILEIAPDSLTGDLLDRVQSGTRQEMPEKVALFPVTCGDKGIDLAEQRLLVSSAFGAYFVGLLERDHSYVDLGGQIEVQGQIEQAALAPLQRLYWALQSPRGPRLIIIAADGGMGKSTLAARLVRCLFDESLTILRLHEGQYDRMEARTQLKLAELLIRRGDCEAAHRLLNQADDKIRSYGHYYDLLWRIETARAYAFFKQKRWISMLRKLRMALYYRRQISLSNSVFAKQLVRRFLIGTGLPR